MGTSIVLSLCSSNDDEGVSPCESQGGLGPQEPDPGSGPPPSNSDDAEASTLKPLEQEVRDRVNVLPQRISLQETHMVSMMGILYAARLWRKKGICVKAKR